MKIKNYIKKLQGICQKLKIKLAYFCFLPILTLYIYNAIITMDIIRK